MLGDHNPDMQSGLESVFECKHFDWTKHHVDVSPEVKESVDRPHLANVHGFDPRNPSGEVKQAVVVSSKYVKSAFDEKLLNVFNEFKPDVVFIHVQKAGVIANEVAREMCKKAVVVNWSGDVRTPIPPHFAQLGKDIDMTLFTNMVDVNLLRKEGIASDFLQVGFDDKHFNPQGSKSDKYPEIIFMGSNYGHTFPLSEYRTLMVKTLKGVFGDKFGVYGAGWDGLGDGLITNYADEGTAYRSCKIAISLSHFDRSKYASDRLFRILGSGAFCLSHNYKDIEKDFDIGNDLDVFNNIQELVTSIQYYLKNDSIRKEIALNGCVTARKNFTWVNFAQNLKKITDDVRLGKKY